MSTPPAPSRHRLATVTFAIVALGAVLAVFPATAPLGFLLCLAALVPAIVAVVRVRRRRAGHPRLAIAALVLAPVFLIVGAGMTATLPRAATPATPTVGTVSAAVAAPARSATAAPTTDPTTVPAVPLAEAPAVAAPAAAAPAAKAAPQPLAAPAKKPAPAGAAAPAKPAPAKPAPAKPAAPKAAASCDESTHYVNSSGNCVPRPVQAAGAPSGASAKCKDGEYSFSQHRSGTCSGHGGVAQWLKDLP